MALYRKSNIINKWYFVWITFKSFLLIYAEDSFSNSHTSGNENFQRDFNLKWKCNLIVSNFSLKNLKKWSNK